MPIELEVVRSAGRFFLGRNQRFSFQGVSMETLPDDAQNNDYGRWVISRQRALIEEKLRDSWKADWVNSTKGITTFRFFPDATSGKRAIPGRIFIRCIETSHRTWFDKWEVVRYKVGRGFPLSLWRS
ncbi:hypothetical protein O3M35_004185 [Rhynocoris fuscipes]|uniref:Uncharacterized protein n=1 Tax=Rhynocoris fuscipes TaxID=488301 RepID=A0AAW1CGP8_9HEMI